jgi:hypothetical protein
MYTSLCIIHIYIHRLTNHKMDAGRHIISITALSRCSVNNFFKFEIDKYTH